MPVDPSRVTQLSGARPAWNLLSALAAVLVMQMAMVPAALAVREVPIDHGMDRDLDAALGISDEFGRWNGTVRLVYDPDGAPAPFASDTQFLKLLDDSIYQWQRVSGIRFEVTGIDRNAPDDGNLPSGQRDGLVRVFWGSAGGGNTAGLAGPLTSDYDSNLGYFPYEDGSLELSNVEGLIKDDFDLVAVLVHELGHVLGLGHSDSPESIMYANPYNDLKYPRADDIRAVQVMYGAPANALDPASTVTEWVYTVPAAASSAVTQYLFKANQHPDSSAATLSVGGLAVTSITSATADGQDIALSGGIGNFNNTTAINIHATLVVVDPSGYTYSRAAWELACGAGSACVTSLDAVTTQFVKTMPGSWKFYVVDESAGAGNASLLLAMTLPVTAAPTYNHPPSATLTVAAGATPASAAFTITATDPESKGVVVVWRPPGDNDWDGDNTQDIEVRNAFASGGSATRTFDFIQTGTYTFYVEVRDDQPRYSTPRISTPTSDPGDGFQTLMKVTVTLPFTSSPTALVVTTEAPATSNNAGRAVLSAIAQTPANPTFIVASDRSATSASFTFGASSDQGATRRTSFTPGESVIIAGGVNPQAADVGKAADIFIVVRTTTSAGDSWTYRTTSGTFAPWNGFISTLQPAASVASLEVGEAFEIHNGTLIAAQHRVYIGYRLAAGNVLHYTGQALSLSVGD